MAELKSYRCKSFAGHIGLLVMFMLWLLPMQASVARNVSLAGGNLQLDQTHGNGAAWGKSKCMSCHFKSGLHAKAPKIRGIVNKKGQATCTGCHGSNGTQAARQCIICHNSKDLPLKPVSGGKDSVHRHDFITGEIGVDKKTNKPINRVVDLKASSRQCVVCHDDSNMNGKFEVDKDLTMFDDAIVGELPYANISEFCLRCHNVDHQQQAWPIKNCQDQSDLSKVKACNIRTQSLRAEDHYQKTDVHGLPEGLGFGLHSGLRSGTYAYQTVVDCTDCHSMHGTKNPNLIIEDSRQGLFLLNKDIREKACSITKNGATITGQPCKIEVDGVVTADDKTKTIDKGNYSDLCVMCHSMTTVSDGGDTASHNGLTGVHTNQGSDCKSCHSHGESVQGGL